MVDLDFFKGKNVFITGHTGFKGTWLCKILQKAGANITGYSIDVPTNPSLYKLCNLESKITDVRGDVRDYESLKKAFNEANPEIVIHLAAQPLVIESYKNPVYTYETNVMGTVNILECVRNSDTVKSFLNVTTDKVYKNLEKDYAYNEEDFLNGYDPYSNSKSCSELITSSYKKSFFADNHVRISTARAGNVIGGGDFAENRIIPDCVRAAIEGKDIIVRNPNSIRPFQHVLEPLFAYIEIVQKQYDDPIYADNYNVGPEMEDCVTVGKISTIFCEKWGNELKWKTENINGPHEANFLKLDCSKIKNKLNWKPTWNIETAIQETVEFSKEYANNGDLDLCMDKQINDFMNWKVN